MTAARDFAAMGRDTEGRVADGGATGDGAQLSRREVVAAGGVLAGAMLMLPGCGGSKSGGQGGTKAGGDGAVSEVAGTPKRGGSIRVGYLGNGSAENLDPNQTYANVDIA